MNHANPLIKLKTSKMMYWLEQ